MFNTVVKLKNRLASKRFTSNIYVLNVEHFDFNNLKYQIQKNFINNKKKINLKI